MYHRPHLVQRVTTASGEVLYDQSTTPGEQRIDPRVARNVTEAMRDVPDYDGVGLQGGRQAAAKTGTVQSHVESQNNDAWFAGYTPQASTVVWVGTDDNTPIRTADGRPVYGHGLPSEILEDVHGRRAGGHPAPDVRDVHSDRGHRPGRHRGQRGEPDGVRAVEHLVGELVVGAHVDHRPGTRHRRRPAGRRGPAAGGDPAVEDPAAAGGVPAEGAEGEGADPPAN